MKKLFLLLLSVTIFSCSGELYENEIVIKDGLAYKKDSSSLYSGVLVDKYGEILGSYKKGTKDGEWIEVDAKKGTQKKANYINGTPDGEQVTYVFPGARENNKRILEGLSFRFHPQHEKIRELISSKLGDLQNFYGIYGFYRNFFII